MMRVKNYLAGLGLVVTLCIFTPGAVKAADAYKVINNNQPEFSAEEMKNTSAFEKYGKLDKLGRCTSAFANVCQETEPTEERGDISKVHPTGWQSNMGWERCHLIGFQLTGENANKKNLITGTHYFNVTGMLPFENEVDDYVDSTGNHVLYRVTPDFEGDNLVASGVKMEAYSVEDDGAGVCFNVYVYNKQPGSKIDYATGKIVKGTGKVAQYISDGLYNKTFSYSKVKKKEQSFSIGCSSAGKVTYSKKSGSDKLSVSKAGKVTIKKGTKAGNYSVKVRIKAASTSIYKAKSFNKTITVTVTDEDDSKTESSDSDDSDSQADCTYVINTSTCKFHYPCCYSVSVMSEKNKKYSNESRDQIISEGYSPCGNCKP